MGLTPLMVVQTVAQTAMGFPVSTTTAKLQGVSTFRINPDLQGRIVNELRGSLAPGFTTVLDGYRAAANFEEEAATYEDINYWLDSLFSAATPGGSTGAYTRAYTAPLTAAAAPTFRTMVYGVDGAEFQLEDTSLTTLTLTGNSNGTLQVGGSLMASRVIPGNLASLSDRTGNTAIMGCHAAVYIDALDGTAGTTEINTSAFAWELTINANR